MFGFGGAMWLDGRGCCGCLMVKEVVGFMVTKEVVDGWCNWWCLTDVVG